MARLIVLFAIFSTVFFLLQEKIFPSPPCEEVIPYSVGTFDLRFGIGQEEFLSALLEAESIWEKPLGRELFVYSATGDLKVNLVYDYRQRATEELSELEEEVKMDKAEYDSLRREYLQLRSDYESLEAAYASRVEVFTENNAKYERDIEEWNSGERTNKQRFGEIESEKRALESELQELKRLEQEINSSVRKINALVPELNSLSRGLNLNVEEYNTIGVDRGETFTGGLYTHDGSDETIDIFEFETREKLIRVLAHELGHALGLEHVTERGAIMSEINTGSRLTLADADLEALNNLCKTN